MPSIDRRRLLLSAAAIAAAPAARAAQTTFSTPSAASANLSGKSILITGCSSGFGRLGAEHYARLGAKVFATMRNMPRPEADELRKLARDENLDIELIEIDVRDDQQVAKGVARAEKSAGGGIDVLVNNAGLGVTGPVELQDMEATMLAFDTNVFGCQRMARAVLPGMRAKKSGQIFQISSQLGRLIVPGAGHYSATKFALEAMGEQMAYELVPHGIDVTIIQPGGYPTKVWVNRNLYTSNLKARAEDERLGAYPQMAAAMGEEDGSGRSTDPMDVPRAIAEIIAMPPGERPLRRAVHPTFRPQEAVNAAMAEAQMKFLGGSPYGPLVKAVLE
ncbi:MAG: SDR family NAD(P)-dependent oxidoreductase [Alphaproteobacteria bacterium]|nr:SDR family NAD(P)-dependent oxidoreductase [Alphaproteobacteria bacterium]